MLADRRWDVSEPEWKRMGRHGPVWEARDVKGPGDLCHGIALISGTEAALELRPARAPARDGSAA